MPIVQFNNVEEFLAELIADLDETRPSTGPRDESLPTEHTAASHPVRLCRRHRSCGHRYHPAGRLLR